MVTINLPQGSLKDPTFLRDNIPFHHDQRFTLASGTGDRFPLSLRFLLQDFPSLGLLFALQAPHAVKAG
jgi:hypothetical protein